MAKSFYTERDIEDLARQGVRSLVVNDDVVLTEMALEKAERLDIQLVRERDTPPSVSEQPFSPIMGQPNPPAGSAKTQSREEMYQRVKSAVVARLGSQVDPALLDSIIRRVFDNIGIK